MSREINKAKGLWILDNQTAICNDKYRDVTRNLNLQHDKWCVMFL